MSIELDWHEGEDHPGVAWQPETEAPFELSTRGGTIATDRGARRGLPLPVGPWLLVLFMLLAFLLAFGGAVLWNASQGVERARRDVDAVVQEVLEARRQGHRELLSAVLDRRDPIWHDRVLNTMDAGTPGGLPRSIKVEEIELDGYRAVAALQETSDDGSTVQRLGFFRLYGGQWHLSQPWPEAMGDERVATTPHLRIIYRQRDEPYVRDLANLAESTYREVCAELGCPQDGRALSLWVHYAGSLSEEQRAAGIFLPPPSLTSIVATGSMGEGSLRQELVRQLAVQITQDKTPEAAPSFWQAIGDWAASDLAGATLPGLSALQDYLQAGNPPLPLDMVWREIVHDGNAANGLASAQMRIFFSFVRSVAGTDALMALVESGHQPFHEIAGSVFATDLGSLENEWRAWLDARPWPQS